jgi:methylmalonyl-CoA mutase N-terminal domain/subunit
MDLWSEFTESTIDQWKNKVLDDINNKLINKFNWETEYGNIDPFIKTTKTIFNEEKIKLSQICWRFNKNKNLNSQILSRLEDGVNSIYINSGCEVDSIFKNVMSEIIQTHICIDNNSSNDQISNWVKWINSNHNLNGSIRMDLFDIYKSENNSIKIDNYIRIYKNITNKNFKCIYVNGLNYNSKLNTNVNDISLIAAQLNELVEIHKKNSLEIPKKVIISTLLNNSFLENISKIKVIRSIINQILNVHELNTKIIIETAINPMTIVNKELDFRILSITSSIMSAIIGGTDIYQLNDSMIESKEDYWKKIITNIPLILLEESCINISDDVVKGSHVIEQITSKMAEKSWALFKEIENKGGILNCFNQNDIPIFNSKINE